MAILASPESVLGDVLTAAPGVARIIGFRAYPLLAPESAALPFVTWRRQSIQREAGLGGPTGVVTVSMVLECYAATYEQVRELADQCRATLDGFPLRRHTAVGIRNVSLQGENDGIVSLAGGEVPPVYAVTQTYTILWGPE